MISTPPAEPMRVPVPAPVQLIAMPPEVRSIGGGVSVAVRVLPSTSLMLMTPLAVVRFGGVAGAEAVSRAAGEAFLGDGGGAGADHRGIVWCR